MWQPRVGLAWDPKGHGTTVIRASAGLYDARTPANLFQRIFTDNNLTTAVLDSKVDPTVLNFVTFPNTLTSIPAGVKPAPQKVLGFDPNFPNPRSFQTSGSVETALNDAWSISAGYTHNSTWGLQRRLDKNLFPATFDATGMPIFPKVRPNPAIAQFSINESEAHSRYDGFDFTVNKRLSHRLQFQAGYIHNSTWGLQRRLDKNLFPATFDATGMPIFPKVRPNPAIAQFSINESEAHSRYDGFDFTVNKRLSHRL